jgi:hypothetical protein
VRRAEQAHPLKEEDAIKKMKVSWKQSGPVIVTLVMLACLAGFAHLSIATEGLTEFRARSKAAIDALPMEVGQWTAEKRPLDAAAKDLLKPNAEATLLYQKKATRDGAYYAVVQVQDCRHMIGHSPPVCYPGNGWTIVSRTPRTWKVGEFEIPGMEYRIERAAAYGPAQDWTVQNFYIFPDGHFGSTGDELDRAAADYRRVAYGAAQIQVVTTTATPQSVRDEVWRVLVGSEKSLEMIRILRSGIPK